MLKAPRRELFRTNKLTAAAAVKNISRKENFFLVILSVEVKQIKTKFKKKGSNLIFFSILFL